MRSDFDTVREKVPAIFAELVGDRARRLDGGVVAEPAMSAFASALAPQYGDRAAKVGFHMADWNAEAAFVVADRFSLPTIRVASAQPGAWVRL